MRHVRFLSVSDDFQGIFKGLIELQAYFRRIHGASGVFHDISGAF